ncbi:hypothetical protein K7432_006008 [Basidiobolus ranarum]|uniref:Uncharacterized protein n=1 Tax=Basidiobolus ranarum TaxID=34480 RepID=A0ABR2WVJ8_9FUNG
MDDDLDEEDINIVNTAFQNAGMTGGYKPRRRGHLTPGPHVTGVTPETLKTGRNSIKRNSSSDDSTSQGFELSLDQATLLSRRKGKADESSSD